MELSNRLRESLLTYVSVVRLNGGDCIGRDRAVISKQARNRKIDLPEPTENVIIGLGVS